LLNSGDYAIAGLGVTDQGRLPGRDDVSLKVESLQLALADAGLAPGDVDGFMFQPGLTDIGAVGRGGDVVKLLGLNPNFIWNVQTGGATAVTMVHMACCAIATGQASVVAINYGDSALSDGVGFGGVDTIGGNASVGVYGMFSPGADHALAARRHMHLFGTTREQLGAIPVTARAYANKRPDAVLHAKPLTMEDYLARPPMTDPLNRHDYCLIADGGTSLIVTTSDRAADLRARPVHVAGIGFGTAQGLVYERTQYSNTGVRGARTKAFGMAGMTVSDIDCAQIYDCFSIAVLLSLEGYGFCEQGEGGPFVADGNLGPAGRLPTNTAGGELAWGYQQGFTPIVEAVRQLRHEAGATQLDDPRNCLVTGHGGVASAVGNMDYAESAMILTKERV
jgi:acetyl-CoA acetyltransferase